MRRREFLGISLAASAIIMTGSYYGNKYIPVVQAGDRDVFMRKPRMIGGCRDFRMMQGQFPGFFEREIIDSWA